MYSFVASNRTTMSDTCCICLDDVSKWASEYTLMCCCGNKIHCGCFATLTSKYTDCPLCRASFLFDSENGWYRLMMQHVRNGKGWALFAIGMACWDGTHGRPQSPDMACIWLEKAVRAGHAEAKIRFAEICYAGVYKPMTAMRAKQLVSEARAEGFEHYFNEQFIVDALVVNRILVLSGFKTWHQRGQNPREFLTRFRLLQEL